MTSPDSARTPHQLKTIALAMVQQRYGTGDNDGQSPKAYHNLAHTRAVLSAADQIFDLAVQRGKIPDSDRNLIEISACFHDVEQDQGIDNELVSAAQAATAMREGGTFSEGEIGRVVKAICATAVTYADGVLTQSATDDYLTQIMADADLSSLSQPPDIYWAWAFKLLQERTSTQHPTPAVELDFARKQLIILLHHQFYTDEARELFTNRARNLEFIRRRIDELEQVVTG